MKVSLIIPAYNEEKYIGSCLEYAIKNSNGWFHEIIVIDNNCTDRTKEIAESFPGVHVVQEPKKGLTRARQRGLEEATGDFLAYIDADTRLPRGWTEKAENVLSKHPEIVSLSGPYKYYDGSAYLRATQKLLWPVAKIAYAIAGFGVLGGNFIARKSALIAMGGFDTSIEFYGEDTDIARRLSKYGKAVFHLDFYIYSSARRLNHKGLMRINIVYALNFIWGALFKKPFSKSYEDIR